MDDLKKFPDSFENKITTIATTAQIVRINEGYKPDEFITRTHNETTF